jgi:hypothetical protein
MVSSCAALVAIAAAAGCGSSTSPPAASSQSTSAPAAGAPGAGLLSAEARSAATGDIPDNQIFVTYRNTQAGYSMSSPEGWTRRGEGSDVTLAQKNNLVHVAILTGSASPSVTGVRAELTRLRSTDPTLTFTTPATMHISAGAAIKATYTTRSAPNPVTGKQVILIVDRYELSGAGKRAIIDLGSPSGVDNVDAYRKMINSFRWQ